MKKNLIIISVLAVILIVLSILAMYTTKKRQAKLESAKPRLKLFELKEDTTSKFELNYNNETIVVQKINGIWNIISPVQYVADQMESLANVKNFNTMMIESTITNLSEVTNFGLDNPSGIFSVWDNGVKHTIYAGNRTGADEYYYAKYNDEYFSLEYVYIEALKKTIDTLREKDFYKIRYQEVLSVLVEGSNYTNEIIKLDGRNFVYKGLEDSTDMAKAVQDFRVLSEVKATGFVKNDKDYGQYGFNRPSIKVTINLEDRSKRVYYLSNLASTIYMLPEGIDKVYKTDYPVYEAAIRDKKYYTKSNKVTNK